MDAHTIDQLILPMALAQGTSRVRGPPKRLIASLHLETAIHMGAKIRGKHHSTFVETSTWSSRLADKLVRCTCVQRQVSVVRVSVRRRRRVVMKRH